MVNCYCYHGFHLTLSSSSSFDSHFSCSCHFVTKTYVPSITAYLRGETNPPINNQRKWGRGEDIVECTSKTNGSLLLVSSTLILTGNHYDKFGGAHGLHAFPLFKPLPASYLSEICFWNVYPALWSWICKFYNPSSPSYKLALALLPRLLPYL